jgi:hypothetical protein
MNNRKVLVLMVVLLQVHVIYAQNYLATKDDLTKHSDKVMLALKNSEFDVAFAELRKHWPMPENELTQLETQTIKQFNMVADRFGTIIATDFVKDKLIKDYVVRKIYVLRFQRHMIRVLFTYYKNDKGWMMNGFKWDDQLDELFD